MNPDNDSCRDGDFHLINRVMLNEPGALEHFLDLVRDIIQLLLRTKFEQLYKSEGDICKDISQDFWLKFHVDNWFFLREYRGEGKLKNFLRTVIFRLIYNKYCNTAEHKRRKGIINLNKIVLNLAEKTFDINKKIDFIQIKVEILKMARDMKSNKDRCVLLGMLEGLEDKEMSDRWNMSMSAIYKRKSCLRNYLKETLKTKGYEI